MASVIWITQAQNTVSCAINRTQQAVTLLLNPDTPVWQPAVMLVPIAQTVWLLLL